MPACPSHLVVLVDSLWCGVLLEEAVEVPRNAIDASEDLAPVELRGVRAPAIKDVMV